MIQRRPYRVLHVIDSLDLGGAQVVLENLIKHGDSARFEFEIAAMHGRGRMWDRLAALGVPMHSLSSRARVPLYVPRLAWQCVTRRYDVVHTHLLAANVIAKPVAAFCGVRVRINHDHCNDKLTDPRRWALRADTMTNRFSTHVVAVSESTRDFLVQHEGVPASRVTTIHNGIDLGVYCPRPELRTRRTSRFSSRSRRRSRRRIQKRCSRSWERARTTRHFARRRRGSASRDV
jgi:L-malate glycosyltransferase